MRVVGLRAWRIRQEPAAAFQAIEQKMRGNATAVLDASHRRRIPPRLAALELATERVAAAKATRRIGAT